MRDPLLEEIAYARVYCAEFGGELGTFFTMEVDKKQYLITAKHLAKKITYDPIGVEKMAFLPVFYNKKPSDLFVQLVGHVQGDVDISVLAATCLIDNSMPSIEPISTNIEYGEKNVFFFGFRCPKKTNPRIIKDERPPLPVIRKSTISYASQKEHLFITEQNNPGFSGSPVLMRNSDLSVNSKNDFYHVIGVMSEYKGAPITTLDSEGHQVSTADENSGTMAIHDIRPAVYMIKSNPIGFRLPY